MFGTEVLAVCLLVITSIVTGLNPGLHAGDLSVLGHAVEIAAEASQVNNS
jgi:hypothetical protein